MGTKGEDDVEWHVCVCTVMSKYAISDNTMPLPPSSIAAGRDKFLTAYRAIDLLLHLYTTICE